ncbi:MAG: response regulator [Phenylobacterium sp.]|uniref:response regulator n=1 Tax=Phenylobacterium sp. TaxID=1871053 RepID=UPI002730A91A|nr:response regulator [Phenylobacterium sp.]MDP2012285.1 response regulator [Phenylobacterium sp.]
MRVLIVEDEILVAMELEETLNDLGHTVVGIAPDWRSFEAFAAEEIDVALVDLNLRDGETGVDIGRALADRRAAVIFVTANPGLLRDGVAGTIGVLPKPATRKAVADVVEYAGRRSPLLSPPGELRLFG